MTGSGSHHAGGIRVACPAARRTGGVLVGLGLVALLASGCFSSPTAPEGEEPSDEIEEEQEVLDLTALSQGSAPGVLA